MKEDREIVYLTGEPVSEELNGILALLSVGAPVDELNLIEQLEETKEIQLAYSHVNDGKPTYLLAGREAERKHIASKLLEKGSANGIDESGQTVYNGTIEKQSRLDVVIGLPGSGKSSVIVDKISAEYKSRVVDNDDAKKMIPEYNHGWGASCVHKESQMIGEMMFSEAIGKKENIVLPRVGANYSKLEKTIEKAKDSGYHVYVHMVDLDQNRALGRMIRRFIHKGRFLSPRLINKYVNKDGNKIEQTYERLKEEGVLDGYSKWDNNVERGESAVCVETSFKADFIQGHEVSDGRRGLEKQKMDGVRVRHGR